MSLWSCWSFHLLEKVKEPFVQLKQRLVCPTARYFATWCPGQLLSTIKMLMTVWWEQIFQDARTLLQLPLLAVRILFRFIHGTAASVPGIRVRKLRHWHCNDFRFCCGFRIACETGYSLTEGAGSHVGFLWTVIYLPHLFPASPPWFLLISDIVLTSNIQSQNVELQQGLLYKLEL